VEGSASLLPPDRWSLIADISLLISMRTVGAESECAGDLRSAGGLVPSIHNALYPTIYQVSIDIVGTKSETATREWSEEAGGN
jgi:hypothetical protein